MRNKLLNLAAAGLLLGIAGAAPAAKTAGTEDKAAAAQAGEKKICKRLETSGTRLGERACHTKAEWKKIMAGN